MLTAADHASNSPTDERPTMRRLVPGRGGFILQRSFASDRRKVRMPRGAEKAVEPVVVEVNIQAVTIFLVHAGQPAVAGHIGRQDGGERSTRPPGLVIGLALRRHSTPSIGQECRFRGVQLSFS